MSLASCIICDQEFVKKTTAKTCSIECRKEHARRRSEAWYYKDHEKNKRKHKANSSARRAKDPIDNILKGRKSDAKSRNIPFDITREDLEIVDVCPVFKVPFAYQTPYAASIDKIDPRKGYVKGNVQLISRKANTMKHDASPEELLKFADWIYSIYG